MPGGCTAAEAEAEAEAEGADGLIKAGECGVRCVTPPLSLVRSGSEVGVQRLPFLTKQAIWPCALALNKRCGCGSKGY